MQGELIRRYEAERSALLLERTRALIAAGAAVYFPFWGVDWIAVPDQVETHTPSGSSVALVPSGAKRAIVDVRKRHGGVRGGRLESRPPRGRDAIATPSVVSSP